MLNNKSTFLSVTFALLMFIFVLSCSDKNNSETGPNSTFPTELKLEILSPAQNDEVFGSINITGTATSNKALSKIEVKLNDGVSVIAVGTTNWSLEYNTVSLTNGQNTINVTAFDTDGTTLSKSITIIVNNTIDIAAKTLSFDSSGLIFKNRSVGFSFEIKNQSNIGLTNLNAKIYAATDQNLTEGKVMLSSIPIDSIEPDDIYSNSNNDIIINLETGTYYIGLEVSGANISKDINVENNSIVSTETLVVQPDRKWTIMIYLNADNNLEQFAYPNFNQLEQIDWSKQSADVLVLFDRIDGYDNTHGDWTGTRLYRVKHDPNNSDDIVSEQLSCLPLGLGTTHDIELDMGDYTVLEKFVSWTKTNYPAAQYGLVLWNHGDGWRNQLSKPKPVFKGISSDDTSNSEIYNHELRMALENGNSVDFIGFDACLMGMIEVAYELKDVARVMTASQELIPGPGWDYNVWLSDFFAKETQTPLELGNSAVYSYQQQYSSQSQVTLSNLDLSKLDTLKTAIDAFALQLINDADDTDIQDARKSSKNFMAAAAQNPWYCYYYSNASLDIVDFANRMSSLTSASSVVSAVDDFVVSEWHDSGSVGSNGLSIYYPAINECLADDYIASGELMFPADSEWVNFVNDINHVPSYYDY